MIILQYLCTMSESGPQMQTPANAKDSNNNGSALVSEMTFAQNGVDMHGVQCYNCQQFGHIAPNARILK